MIVGNFPCSDSVGCVVNIKLSALNSTDNIECWINVNNDI